MDDVVTCSSAGRGRGFEEVIGGEDAAELGFLKLSCTEGGLHVAEEIRAQRGELWRDLDGFGVHGLHDKQ